MMPDYAEDDFLPLSGIQHMAFCERQWALIHIEQQWEENVLTVEGRHIHEHADNPFENETRHDARITRRVPIVSGKLGLRGIADVVEYIRDDDSQAIGTIFLKGKPGKWKLRPIEYKRGRPKPDDRDSVQLCAQAIALEEMMNVTINEGYLYYNEIRRRQTIIFDNILRDRVVTLSTKMHLLASLGVTPRAKKEIHCLRCSLYEICQPDWKSSGGSVGEYLTEWLSHEDDDLP